MQKQSLERLKDLLEYDANSGRVFVKKSKRVLVADHDGIVMIFDNQVKPKHKKYKLDKIAFYLAFSQYPREDQRVLHKNLDLEDNRLINLALVSRSVYRQIKEASKNISGGIRIVPHATDQFTYILHWFENGAEKVRLVHDIVVARRYMLRLQLKYSKILTKYCVFD